MDDRALGTLIMTACKRTGAFRGPRIASAWGRAFAGPAALDVLHMNLRYTKVEDVLARGSLTLIADQAAHQRGVLHSLIEDTKALNRRGDLNPGDATEIIRDVATTDAQLAALERRAARGGAGDIVPESVRSQALKVLQPEPSALFRGVSLPRLEQSVAAAGRAGNPVMHQHLERAFAGGPFADGVWIQRLAYYLTTVRGKGSHAKVISQHLEEMLGVSHAAHRKVIHDTSGILREHGLEPVEMLSGGWLFNAEGAAGRKEFRDGGLLGVLRRGAGRGLAGEAVLAVHYEARQAQLLAEAAWSAAARQLALEDLPYDAALSAALQQAGGQVRTARAIEKGQFFMTADGSFFRLRPLPKELVTHVLARPYLLPPEYVQMAAGRGANLVQIVTEFDSRQLASYANPLVRRLLLMLML
ncbi:hypothetical protein [Streptomyces boninensis]|uniref:hypothetical protein n=1 Tax=Streptomyces boninensis TaxID=2039455 RepID=UPI003B21E1B0